MPDPNVDVTFNPDGKAQFTFDPPSVPMREKGKIIFHRRPQDAVWTFVEGIVKEDKLNQFSSEKVGNGKLLHIHDEFKDEVTTTYEYKVIVELGGVSYVSPDPVIVNEPGMELD
jgi:hypothetical protein